ncbi:NADP-dependent malic enzyme [Candidatus Bodocaedibacter vickermanii]|uniref:NADP-dependent malic enzyme n=1 Tax=Candidatus Bodocaedibacter vickermanii TaxID=2741701 RepID=A0A7L9RSC4_9PROT|nr:NADP-dependent malic enzyme [Candidatus Paracaedibacteraceae bacterium 'Lake Konstanz']
MSKRDALKYHQYPTPGKLAIVPTKTMATQQDLALAYSPGVAYACEAIVEDSAQSYNLTSKGNLVAVISNGTAVLGLGDIGPDAAKPVMEGKAVLFKRFAGIDVFDIEINEKDPKKLVDIIAAISPTFGGINLEDIAAPECFYVEQELQKRLNIPVFHDDQHGTAIVASAGLINALKLVNKDISNIKIVCSGAGAAAIACLNLFVDLGANKENIYVCDREGLIYNDRPKLTDPQKLAFAQHSAESKTLGECMESADVFLGLSAKGVLKKDDILRMNARPIIMAMANPDPEITPEDVKSVRDDAIIATGRSDYPNQVNNVLCFPYMFRAALDVQATHINTEMKLACVNAIARLAEIESSESVRIAYGDAPLSFGNDYIIPKPFDPRLLIEVVPAIAKAAMDSGIAKKPIEDFEAYRHRLTDQVYKSGYMMRPIFEKLKVSDRRVIFTDGANEKVLFAVQQAVDEKIFFPVLIGSRSQILQKISELKLRLIEAIQFEIVDIPSGLETVQSHADELHKKLARKGITPFDAEYLLEHDAVYIAAMQLLYQKGHAVICGPSGKYYRHLEKLVATLGLQDGVAKPTTLEALITEEKTVFISDSYVNYSPTAHDIASSAELCVKTLAHFGVTPRVALLSCSNFGSVGFAESSKKMREAKDLIVKKMPDLMIDGEMSADVALSKTIRDRIFPTSDLKDDANLLIAPSQDAANIAINLARTVSNGLRVGPVLLGLNKIAHIAPRSSTSRSILNLAAIAAVQSYDDV